MEPLRNVTVTPTEVVITFDLPYADTNEIQVRPIGEDEVDILAKMKRKTRLDDLGISTSKANFRHFSARHKSQYLYTLKQLKFNSREKFRRFACPGSTNMKYHLNNGCLKPQRWVLPYPHKSEGSFGIIGFVT